MGVLTVKLIKVTNLRDEDGIGKSDPYVKFELEQDNYVFDKNYGKQVSSKKKNDLNPEYNETFTYADIPSLNNMVLIVKIMDDDVGFDAQLGACKIKLEHMGLNETPKSTEVVVDKKSPKVSICNPCKFLFACCCSLFKRDAEIHLELSYVD